MRRFWKELDGKASVEQAGWTESFCLGLLVFGCITRTLHSTPQGLAFPPTGSHSGLPQHLASQVVGKAARVSTDPSILLKGPMAFGTTQDHPGILRMPSVPEPGCGDTPRRGRQHYRTSIRFSSCWSPSEYPGQSFCTSLYTQSFNVHVPSLAFTLATCKTETGSPCWKPRKGRSYWNYLMEGGRQRHTRGKRTAPPPSIPCTLGQQALGCKRIRTSGPDAHVL